LEIIDSILKLSQVGALGLCLFALFGAYKGWWVPGRTYDEAVKREESWKAMYEREKAARELDHEKDRQQRVAQP
jgi:hypothetical protein